MTHPRTLIREHAAREIVRRGAYSEAVFVNRVAPFSDEDHFPNVCIYTDNESTAKVVNAQNFDQQLILLFEIRERRSPDMLQPWRAIDGMPAHPAQVTCADRLLDDVCEQIEAVVFAAFNLATFTVEGQKIQTGEITEVNTEISRGGDGDVPYMLAQLEFKLSYQACYPAAPIDTCPLEHFFGVQRHNTNGIEGQSVPVSLFRPSLPETTC